MADDENFDIDIYGDDSGQNYQESAPQQEVTHTGDAMNTESTTHEPAADTSKTAGTDAEMQQNGSSGVTNGDAQPDSSTQQIASTGTSVGNQAFQKQAPQQQGTKRKLGEDDDRPMAPGATAALMINDLNWWISEEDIRGWANQGGCEDELNEVTFNEHKVNGKSKGQVYVQLKSPQAATALKQQIEALYQDQAHAKKPTAIFNPPHVNPFKTLPKDVPARDKNRGDRSTSSNYSSQGSQGGNYNNGRGNFRGNFRGNIGGYQNRNFSGPAGNMGGNMGGGYGNPSPMNFGGAPMAGGMNQFGGGGFNRGGMMGGMRGGMANRGRGGPMGMNGMGGGMGAMGGMPMGGNMMGMGGAGMGMMAGNMGMMNGMGPGPGGFGGAQPQFNQPFYGQGQQGGDGNWNPHGNKRQRPE